VGEGGEGGGRKGMARKGRKLKYEQAAKIKDKIETTRQSKRAIADTDQRVTSREEKKRLGGQRSREEV